MRDPLGIEWWLRADQPSGRPRSRKALALIFVALLVAFGMTMEVLDPGRFSVGEAAREALIFGGILVLLARLQAVSRRRR